MEKFSRTLKVSMQSNKWIILTFLLLLAGSSFAQKDSGIALRSSESAIYSSVQQDNQIELYPNPAVDFLIVDISNSSINNVEFELHSMIGNKIRIEPEEIGNNRYRIPLKEFSTGYYFLVVKDEFSRFKKAYKFLKN